MTPIALRPTTPADLDFVLAIEHRPDNQTLIGRWTRDEHLAVMARGEARHVVIDSAGTALGYLIAFDVRAHGYGFYVKRIAVNEVGRGTGRVALAQFAAAAWTEGAALVSLAVRTHNERAQRCYRAVGFETWSLDETAWAGFLARVDASAAGCLIMRRLRDPFDSAQEPQ